MRSLLFLALIGGAAYYGLAINPGVGLFQEQVGSAEVMGFGAKACKYQTLVDGERTLVLTKMPGEEDAASNECPQFVLLTDERLNK